MREMSIRGVRVRDESDDSADRDEKDGGHKQDERYEGQKGMLG